MATRTFDYKTVESIYLEMNKIIGDNNESDSLSGILTSIDKEYRDMVGQVDKACYGALADQLLLDWGNTSSDFPKFIENFQNWAALVSSAAGDYAQFEQQVTGLQQENQYGFAGAGLQNNYVESSAYHEYAANSVEAFDYVYANLNNLYELTGCTYLQSGASGRLKTQHVLNCILTGGDALAIAVIAAGAYSYFAGGTAAAGTELAPVTGGGTGGVTAGGTSMLGEGYAVSIEEAMANAAATNNTALLSQLTEMQAQGVSAFVMDSTGTMGQVLNSSGQVMYTFTADAATATQAATGATQAATSAGSSTGFWSNLWGRAKGAWGGAKNAFSTGTSSAVNGAKNAWGTARTAMSGAKGWAGTAFNSMRSGGGKVVSAMRAHPIRTAAITSGVVGVPLGIQLGKK